MTPRSVGDIALIPKNYKGLYYLMSLDTGIRIHARQWTVLHFTKLVINRAEQIYSDKGINEIVGGDMLF